MLLRINVLNVITCLLCNGLVFLLFLFQYNLESLIHQNSKPKQPITICHTT